MMTAYCGIEKIVNPDETWMKKTLKYYLESKKEVEEEEGTVTDEEVQRLYNHVLKFYLFVAFWNIILTINVLLAPPETKPTVSNEELSYIDAVLGIQKYYFDNRDEIMG